MPAVPYHLPVCRALRPSPVATATPTSTPTLFAKQPHVQTDDSTGCCDVLQGILIPISITGWIIFGIICVLVLNSLGARTSGFRWMPVWYRPNYGRCWAVMEPVAWWGGVVLLWPVLLPALGLAKLWMCCKEKRAETTAYGEGAGPLSSGRRGKSRVRLWSASPMSE